jgi:hypothetical protein
MRRKLSIIAVLLATTPAHFVASSVHSDSAVFGDDRKPATEAPAGEIRLHARVVDTAGKPVLNANVQVHVLTSREDTHTSLVELAGSSPLKVDPGGTVLTSALEAGRAYILQVEAPRMLPTISRWSRPRDAGTVHLPDVVLRRLLTVTGTVAGRDGRAIAGAAVIQSGDCPDRTDAITDAQGQFTIDGVPEGDAFLFAHAPDYRFTGQKVAAEKGPVRFKLERRDDPNPAAFHDVPTRRPKLSPDDRKTLALALIKPRFDEMLAHDPPQWDGDFLVALAEIDSEIVLSKLDRLEAARPSADDHDQLLLSLVSALAKTDAKKAEQLIGKIKQPSRQLQAYGLNLIPALPKSASTERKRLLAEASEIARREADAYWIGLFLVPLLVKHDETALARTLLDETRLVAAKLPAREERALTMFGYLAMGYANIDTQIAMEMMRAAHERFFGDVAQVLARRDPDAVERALKRLDFQRKPELKPFVRHRLPEICYRLGLKGADRAERIIWQLLEKIQPPAQSDDEPPDAGAAIYQAQLLGLLAEGARRSDKLKAKQFLEQAMATLQPLSAGHFHARLGWYFAPATVLSTLIPVAEEIDPALAREMFWRSLAMRVPPFKCESAEQQSHDFSLAFLALMLDRYDHDTADAIFGPIMERETSRAVNGAFIYPWVYLVRARLDPQTSVQFAQELLAAPPDRWEPPTAATLRQLTAAHLMGPRATAADDEERTLREVDRRMVRSTLQIYVSLDDE